MKGKRPLVVLLIAMLTIGMVGVFAAAPVAAQEVGTDDDDNENECEVEAENEANQAQTAVGAYIGQDQTANQNAEASINSVAKVNQGNWQESVQQASGSNVAQLSGTDQDASNTAKVSQCEANQNA